METKLRTKNRLSYLLISVVLVFIFLTTSGQVEKRGLPFEFSTGYGMLIYQSGYGLDNSYGVEFLAGKPVNELLKLEAGFRLGLDYVQPDAFLRVCASSKFGLWRPAIGIESGYSNRISFNGRSSLLKETRDAMSSDPGHFYLSSHAQLFSFEFKKNWSISLLEINFGTHYNSCGTTLRLQTTLIRILKKLK
jgi:hypothetical protein